MKAFLVFATLVVAAYSLPAKRSGCNNFCPMYIIKFCGSDGVTYNSNECFLKSQWCNEGRDNFDAFHTLHMGECTGTELLDKTVTKPVPTTEELLLS